jgi:hypothetical protein
MFLLFSSSILVCLSFPYLCIVIICTHHPPPPNPSSPPQTLLIPGTAAWPLVMVPSIFVPAPIFTNLPPVIDGPFEFQVELIDDEPVLAEVAPLSFECENSEYMGMLKQHLHHSLHCLISLCLCLSASFTHCLSHFLKIYFLFILFSL